MSSELIQVQNESWQVGILPQTGASIAFARIRLRDRWVDFLRPTPPASYGTAFDTASYPLLPWSNRIRDGKFRFRGAEYQLRKNFPDGTAIHGTACEYPWKVERAEPTRLTLQFDSRTAEKVNWPFSFSGQIEFKVEGGQFSASTRLKSEAAAPFCAGFGHHPYFCRTLTGPEDQVRLEVPCGRYYLAEGCMPKAASVEVEPRVDFRAIRPLGTAFVDDCLTGRIGSQPVRFSYPQSGATIEMSMSAVFSHLVVYIPVGKTFFAVEPVTHANDGFNLSEAGVPGTGVFVLEPGQQVEGTYALRLA